MRAGSNTTFPPPSYLNGITQASIRLQLAKEEAEISLSESEVPLHPDVTAGFFISTGIDLEDQQYVFF